ncbi:MAG: hypothetical protein PHQ04_05660 [Opitutaceae bacterium]|nr:hypothetical protein [Opitutaceae bacterium]
MLGLVHRCWLPGQEALADVAANATPQQSIDNKIGAIVAVDGGYTEVVARKEYPSATIAFFQFGLLLFKVSDLQQLSAQPFIAPEDMAKLKNLERIKLALPTKNLRFKDGTTLVDTIRQTIFEFFVKQKIEDSTLIETLAWFVFQQFRGSSRPPALGTFHLGQNPHARNEGVDLNETAMQDFHFTCPRTGKPIYLTDIFRFHEVIDEEHGASGILGYLGNVIEHLLIIHLLKTLLAQQPSALKKILFIKDGPTGFFGQTARLFEPMRQLASHLWDHHDFHLVGLEKSDAFVEHAQHIAGLLHPSTALILSNSYIYRHILPGNPDSPDPYGSTSNYGHKVIFKTATGRMHVISIPSRHLHLAPIAKDLPNFQSILANVAALQCDMYDSAIVPVALVNKLVSLADHPSARILQKFAASQVSR